MPFGIGTKYTITVNPKLPARLERLEELANDLWYSWDRDTRTLFSRLDPKLWQAVEHNPKAFLMRVDESILLKASEDQSFISNFNSVLSAYDSYCYELPQPRNAYALQATDQIAYFCFEFGFHESLPIYSGGLGILAGDHCKAASDLRLPFVGIGLLFRQGYFFQTIDNHGVQQVTYSDSDFEDLPVRPVLHDDGSEVCVNVTMAQRDIKIKIWQVKVGHVTLYLLDTDLSENSPQDRFITHQLYGGDQAMRIEQEIVLGIGGVRALHAIGVKPTVWHINEGHAAFMILERIRNLVRQGQGFSSALEVVAANTVFTTHTAVPAGHDHFSRDMMQDYFDHYIQDVNISREEFMLLGDSFTSADFNMTALAIHGSRMHNGVSKIHGDVSANICQSLWPQIKSEENPISYVTNGVHVPTFLATEWSDLFDRYLGHEWRSKLCDIDYWSRIYDIPDHLFWSVRQTLKSHMLYGIRARLSEQNFRNHGSGAHLDRLLKFTDPVNPNILALGFARRFATYKRATLLFEDLDWLKNIIIDQKHPILLLFAGKAHPADKPGQELIRRISEISHMPDFEGRLLLIENYDLRLARRLVAGVDIWLNNPVFPLEASGTSGMKAGINGALNLSILDGWWGEGYDGKNGWAIRPGSGDIDPEIRDQEESRAFYEILQDQVVPLYFSQNNLGFSSEWVKMAKHSMVSLLPRYSATRMVDEYVKRFYQPASKQGKLYSKNNFENANKIAEWKAKIRNLWQGVAIRRLDSPYTNTDFGNNLHFKIAVNLNGLKPEDVVVELLLSRQFKIIKINNFKHFKFNHTGVDKSGEDLFDLELTPELCGRQVYYIRVYPYHQLLTHPLEMGMMLWL